MARVAPDLGNHPVALDDRDATGVVTVPWTGREDGFCRIGHDTPPYGPCREGLLPVEVIRPISEQRTWRHASRTVLCAYTTHGLANNRRASASRLTVVTRA